jgi:hypothetical protein
MTAELIAAPFYCSRLILKVTLLPFFYRVTLLMPYNFWILASLVLSRVFFVVKIYLQYVNTHTLVPDSTKIVPGQPISCRTLAVRGGHGAASSGEGRYSSKKMAQKKKHCSRRV